MFVCFVIKKSCVLQAVSCELTSLAEKLTILNWPELDPGRSLIAGKKEGGSFSCAELGERSGEF